MGITAHVVTTLTGNWKAGQRSDIVISDKDVQPRVCFILDELAVIVEECKRNNVEPGAEIRYFPGAAGELGKFEMVTENEKTTPAIARTHPVVTTTSERIGRQNYDPEREKRVSMVDLSDVTRRP